MFPTQNLPPTPHPLCTLDFRNKMCQSRGRTNLVQQLTTTNASLLPLEQALTRRQRRLSTPLRLSTTGTSARRRRVCYGARVRARIGKTASPAFFWALAVELVFVDDQVMPHGHGHHSTNQSVVISNWTPVLYTLDSSKLKLDLLVFALQGKPSCLTDTACICVCMYVWV